MTELKTKEELLNKLRAYAFTSDDDVIKYKNIVKNKLLDCPELLYSLNDEEFISELFDDNGNMVVDEDGNLIGDVDKYFGENSLIRPVITFPGTQTEVKNFLCYQVGFENTPRYGNGFQKYTQIIFTIFVNNQNLVDALTGIPRHDLIGSILRERFNWSNIFGMQTHLISNKESTTDNDYVVRTLVFQITDLNSMVTTANGKSNINNYQLRR